MTLGPWYTGDNLTTNLEVHVQRDGEAVELDGYDSATALLYSPAGEQVAWDATATIDTSADVVNIAPPSESPFETAGFYLLYIRMTATGGSETFFVTDISILTLGGVESWASVSKARSITGEVVTDEDIMLAQGVIELYAGRTYAGSKDNDSIRPKDKGWLQKAVAYQAVWQRSQPGYLTRHAVKQVNQDGAQVIYTDSTEPNNTGLIMLAPLANRALRNVSWMRSRTIKIKSPTYEGPHPSYGDYKRNDDHPGWRPM